MFFISFIIGIIVILLTIIYFRCKNREYSLEKIENMKKEEFINFVKSNNIMKFNVNDIIYNSTIKKIDVTSSKILPFSVELYRILKEKLSKIDYSKGKKTTKKKFFINPKFSKNDYEKNFDESNNNNNICSNKGISFDFEINSPTLKYNTEKITINEFNESMKDGQIKIDMLGISKNMLGDLSELNKNQILNIYNNISKSNFIHNIGKGSLIYKSVKKGSLNDLKSFRQIIAIPSIVSQLHRIYSLRLCEYMIKNNYLDTTIQKCGGAGNKNPLLEQIVKMKNTIKHAVNNKKGLNILFIDISDAFPSLNIEKMCYVLEKYGVSESLITYIKTFYKNFTYYTATKQWKSKNIVWNRGLLQGCPLSPSLFVIVLNYIFKHLEKKFEKHSYQLSDNKKVLFVAYMDDIAVLTNNITQMKEIYSEIEKLLAEFNLIVNKQKTAYMEINASDKNQDDLLDPNFNISKVYKYTYLGELIYNTGSSQNSLRNLAMMIKSKMIWLDKSTKLTLEEKARYITSCLVPLIQRKLILMYDVDYKEKIKVINIIKIFTDKWNYQNDNIQFMVNIDIQDILKNTNDEVLKNMVFENIIYNSSDDENRDTKVKLSELQFDYDTIENDEVVLSVNSVESIEGVVLETRLIDENTIEDKKLDTQLNDMINEKTSELNMVNKESIDSKTVEENKKPTERDVLLKKIHLLLE